MQHLEGLEDSRPVDRRHTLIDVRKDIALVAAKGRERPFASDRESDVYDPSVLLAASEIGRASCRERVSLNV